MAWDEGQRFGFWRRPDPHTPLYRPLSGARFLDVTVSARETAPLALRRELTGRLSQRQMFYLLAMAVLFRHAVVHEKN